MKISTLEMIHETLKNEYEMAHVNYADALKEAARCEKILADATDAKAAMEAEAKLDAAKQGSNEARAWATRTQDALRDFEAQEF